MTIRIPEQRQDAMAQLLQLTDDQWSALADAANAQDPTDDPDTLIERISSDVQGTIQDAQEILRVLLALGSVRLSNRNTISVFLDELKDALKQTGRPDLDPDSVDWAQLNLRFSDLLDESNPLCGSVKIRTLSWDRPNVFDEARVITDLRPVFGASLSDAPQLLYVVHTLRVNYHEGNQLREFYLSLEGSELRELRNEIARAITKETSLIDTIGQQGWQIKSDANGDE